METLGSERKRASRMQGAKSVGRAGGNCHLQREEGQQEEDLIGGPPDVQEPDD